MDAAQLHWHAPRRVTSCDDYAYRRCAGSQEQLATGSSADPVAAELKEGWQEGAGDDRGRDRGYQGDN